ncbi:anti-phage protein Ppl [Photobacterium sp. Alg240-V54]|uniref:anti-phage protein Ppl n=1 Tax=Photobacterium sp. Alg240-V54 TaxID=2305995 RepID=UPI0013D10D1B|nr:anti-phage protein Ppl [Photobacterium sp. Alg240-V54]
MSIGSKWYKFDFHNHTPASNDYQESELSNRDWLLAYMRQEIDAVVISDHNTGAQIDGLKLELSQMQIEAENGDLDGFRALTLFPGVELTATGNVHVLAVFDELSTSADIERLIGQCNGNAPVPRELNYQLVLRGGVASIISSIKQYTNAVCILAHIDAAKGILSVSNQTELNNAFEAKPDGLEIRFNLSDITNGTHKRLIEDLPKLRGSDAHHPDNAGLRTCWLKMSELNFDGLKSALLDHENCILLDSLPPLEPNFQLRKLKLKTRICSSEDNQPTELEFSPFYNAIIGSRGSGKSTIIESIRLGMRKDNDLSPKLNETIERFKSIGKGMDEDSEIECTYRKDGSDFKLTWKPGNKTTLHSVIDGELVEDFNWSTDRFGISIYSQKMLFELASDNDAFLKVCDESKFVNKRQWKEKKEELERNFKNEQIHLRDLLAKKSTSSALSGQLSDVSRSIDKLSESSYYTVKTNLSRLELEHTSIHEIYCSEKAFLDDIDNKIPAQTLYENSTEKSEQYHTTLQQFKIIQAQTNRRIRSALEEARQQYDALCSSSPLIKLAELITSERDNVIREASTLRAQGLDPDKLDGLVEQQTNLEAELREYTDLNVKINQTEQNIAQILIEIKEHRKALTEKRKEFIASLNLDGLEIKILPLNAPPKSIVLSYQEVTGIQSFFDRIYDQDAKTGFLKQFIEHQTYASIEHIIEQKYAYLNELKERHINIVNGTVTEPIDIHGSYKKRIEALSDESLDNLICWFPDDGIHIRYRALNSRMEDIESASPGQKASSMLQFLLSYGTDPLLLDQPEDDLDCMMLSKSVIPSIAANKQRRQLIIVSHSAPIVVNGDAEYVISMIHDKNGLRPNICGALQTQDVKELICNQMEGGEKAFRSRFSRILS